MRLGGMLIALTLFAACSSSGTKSSPSSSKVTVEVTADRSGLGGCNATAPIDGTNSPLTVKDQTGTVVATTSFHITTPGTVCDWTASFTLNGDPTFLTFVGSKGDLGTVSRDRFASGRVLIHADAVGQVTIS